ncbi:MAG: hypothetical protein NXY59_02870 [Aigarchaeota archaeon]|nr:hypothetical protein [Candidatus Pelearchaeum maunauluense]
MCVKKPSEAKEEIVYTPAPQPTEKAVKEKKEEKTAFEEYTRIYLKLNVPIGQISTIAKIVNYLNGLFKECKVRIEITAQNGKIRATDYENKIEEALRQAGVDVESKE